MHLHIPQPSPLHPSSSQHSYGTRTRRNSTLKSSARLRQSPPPHLVPRRIKPVPLPAPDQPTPASPDPCLPIFPPPGVMLHPEDASNKVFHAIGRSFISVENRAMTIKDLAEMTLKYGLMCQNVSAASQAITTYIRNHMARCDAQQDHPLLLRHVLSGTLTDDNLVPALYSRVGGAPSPPKSGFKDQGINGKHGPQVIQGPLEGERRTNFRRGTMVWYLSKAAGVSCPFARAGIRLCEYGKEGRKATAKHNDELSKKQAHCDEVRCGEKRKRLRRGCRRSRGSQESSSAARDSQSPATDSGYGELSADSSDDERPPKVKLTLRLRPSLPYTPTPVTVSRPREVIDLSNDTTGSSSEDDLGNADDVDMQPTSPEVPWSLPPYPRRSISVPCYTPTCDQGVHSPLDQCHVTAEERRRSPSVPWSASPPPDSDHDDFDLDSDVDWDSSSFSAPSPAPALQVKIETTDQFELFNRVPADIRGMLDAWEDLDCAPTSTVSSTVKLPATHDLGYEALELWDWEFESGWIGVPDNQQDLPAVKMERDEHECPFPAFVRGSPASSCSPFTFSFHYSSSPPTSELNIDPFAFHTLLTPSALPASNPPLSFQNEINRGSCALTWQDAELLGPDTVHPHEFEDGWTSGVRMHPDCNLPPKHVSGQVISSSLFIEPEDKADVACTMLKETRISHAESKMHPSHSSCSVAVPDIVVVRTCRPCAPDICATQIEGISVYQTVLGRIPLLRRIDTDFVNLSTILSYLSLPAPSPLPIGCVSVSHSSVSIHGIWAPLTVARLYARRLPRGLESTFLSDDLVMRFPTALQDFYRKSTSGRLLNQFGPHFNDSCDIENPVHVSQFDHVKPTKDDVWGATVEAGHVDEPLFSIPPSVNDALSALHPPTSTDEVIVPPEAPLSPTEQEMFRVLCVHPDWEIEETEAACDGGKDVTTAKLGLPIERPLRRSRRVADAVAARSRATPPTTKGPRHS